VLTDGDIPFCTINRSGCCNPKLLALESNFNSVVAHVVLRNAVPRTAHDDESTSLHTKQASRLTKGASKEISIDFVILRAQATVIAIDADAPPKPAGVLHEIDESEYHELEGHAEFDEKREEKREMATDT